MKEFLFWLHVLLILVYIYLGFFVSFWVVFFVFLIHRIHLKIFGGCIITKLQKKKQHIQEELVFFQVAVKRFFSRDIDLKTVDIIDYGVACLALLIAFGVSFIF